MKEKIRRIVLYMGGEDWKCCYPTVSTAVINGIKTTYLSWRQRKVAPELFFTFAVLVKLHCRITNT